MVKLLVQSGEDKNRTFYKISPEFHQEPHYTCIKDPLFAYVD